MSSSRSGPRLALGPRTRLGVQATSYCKRAKGKTGHKLITYRDMRDAVSQGAGRHRTGHKPYRNQTRSLLRTETGCISEWKARVMGWAITLGPFSRRRSTDVEIDRREVGQKRQGDGVACVRPQSRWYRRRLRRIILAGTWAGGGHGDGGERDGRGGQRDDRDGFDGNRGERQRPR